MVHLSWVLLVGLLNYGGVTCLAFMSELANQDVRCLYIYLFQQDRMWITQRGLGIKLYLTPIENGIFIKK